MQKRNLLLVKIGGGVITDKTERYALREEVLERVGQEISEAWRELEETDLIIGNGAGSFAHYSAHEYKTAKGFVNERSKEGMGWVRYDAVKLNQIVTEELLNKGVPVFSVSPSSCLRVAGGEVEEFFGKVIEDLLALGMVPAVYGDVVVDRERGCGIFSTEKVFEVIVEKLREKRKIKVIHVNAEEGVVKNLKLKMRDSKLVGEIIPVISKENWDEVKKYLGESGGVDVTGGMIHKVEECLKLTDWGVGGWIVSGLKRGRIKRAMLGEEVRGTRIMRGER